MKSLYALSALACTILLISCGGPSRTDLRMELNQIEGEMVQLEMLAYNLRSQMNQAEWESFIGGFAGGFGLVSGNGQLMLQGAGTANNATGNYNRANYNLRQVVQRYNFLNARRDEILKKLR